MHDLGNISETIKQRRAEYLVHQIPFATAGTLFAVVWTTLLLWKTIDTSALLTWAVVTACVIFARMSCAYRYFNDQSNAQPNGIILYRILLWINGLCWGLVTGGFLIGQNIEIVLLLMMLFIALSSGSITTLAADPPSLIGYLLLTLLPAVWTTLSLPNNVSHFLIPGYIMLIIMLLGTAKTHIRKINETIISEYKAKRKANYLEKAKQRLLINLNSTPLAYIEFNQHKKVTNWNPAAARIFGYHSSEIIGKSVLTLFSQDMTENYLNTHLFVNDIEEKYFISDCITKENDAIQCEWYVAELSDDESIFGFAAFVQDISIRVSQERLINRRENYDELTDLPNRSVMTRFVTDILRKNTYSNELFGLIFIDIDNFKHINDALGHGTGDLALQTFSQRFKDCLYTSDILSRFSSDEFVLLIKSLPKNDPEKCKRILEKITSKIIKESNLTLEFSNVEVVCGASLGVTTFPIFEGQSSEDVFRHADLALQEAKRTGKNKVCFYSEKLDASAVNRVELLSELRNALANQEFKLYLQPKINLANGSLVGAEGLTRWLHPEKGLVTPFHFIPTLESSSLIFDFGEWVIDEAMRMLVDWKSKNIWPNDFRLAINICPKQLLDMNFIKRVTRLMKKHNVSGKHFEFEITESILIENFDTIIDTLNKLVELKIDIAIDDFGTGYSSLSYLSRIPLSVLKIDRSFVKEMNQSESVLSIVKAILSISEDMKLKTVAEGIETVEQFHLLKELNCLQFQGFIFSPAVPADQFEQMLLQSKNNTVLFFPKQNCLDN